MTDGVKVKIRRKDRLFAKLRASVPAVQKALEKVNEKSALEMVAAAERFAPRDSGNLAAAIYQEEVQTGGSPARKVAVDQGNGPTGQDAFYASFVEFGTQDRPAQPFFFPAYRLVSKRHRGRATRAINKILKSMGVKK